MTLRDLLFWATIEREDARDDRIRAVWEMVVRKIRECVKTYHGEEDQHGPRKPDVARRV